MKAAGASHDPGALGRAPRLDAWTRRGDELAELSSLIEDMRATVDVGMCASPQPEYLYCLSSALRGTGGGGLIVLRPTSEGWLRPCTRRC